LTASPIRIRPPVRWRGAKWRVGPWILEHFPPHELYVEPFAGSGSLLFQKEPARFECINDLDGDVVTFFRVLRERKEALVNALMLTPYAREELRACLKPAKDDLERARRFFTRCHLGRGNASRPSGFRPQKTSYGWNADVVRRFRALDHLDAAAERLRLVQIECLPALEVIRRFDHPGALFYVDPPYLGEARNPHLYTREMMGKREHRELAVLLRSLRGMVVLSGAPSSLYAELYGDWRMESRETYGEQHKRYTECLWISPNADKARLQQSLFGSEP